jgi:sarcosine oxidase subunit gamma
VNDCARTLLAKAEVVLWRRGAEEYHLEVARSFADYVLEWMREVNRSDNP